MQPKKTQAIFGCCLERECEQTTHCRLKNIAFQLWLYRKPCLFLFYLGVVHDMCAPRTDMQVSYPREPGMLICSIASDCLTQIRSRSDLSPASTIFILSFRKQKETIQSTATGCLPKHCEHANREREREKREESSEATLDTNARNLELLG